MIHIQTIALHHVIEQIEEHHQRHYQEMTEGDEMGFPDVDWDLYKALSHAGHMVATVLKDSDNLVGYVVFSISHNQRHMKRLEASNEAFFIEKPYRLQWAKPLVKTAIANNMQMGIDATNFSLSDDRIGRWLGTMGAKTNYKIWTFNHGN